MADSRTEDFVNACSKVGELLGQILVLQLSAEKERLTTALEKEQLLTRKQAAKRMSVSVSTFDGWRRQGVVKPVEGLGERTVRYRESDLEQLIAQKKARAGRGPWIFSKPTN